MTSDTTTTTTGPAPTRMGPATFTWGQRTFVMGILNVTPDSFSGDGLLGARDLVERAVTTARHTSFTSSPVVWNSRFATERAGLRIGSRFIRQTKLRSVLAGGK